MARYYYRCRKRNTMLKEWRLTFVIHESRTIEHRAMPISTSFRVLSVRRNLVSGRRVQLLQAMAEDAVLLVASGGVVGTLATVLKKALSLRLIRPSTAEAMVRKAANS